MITFLPISMYLFYYTDAKRKSEGKFTKKGQKHNHEDRLLSSLGRAS
jgi:hypothetical protein